MPTAKIGVMPINRLKKVNASFIVTRNDSPDRPVLTHSARVHPFSGSTLAIHSARFANDGSPP